ncbi:rod shape-determining protein MreC [Salsuginibacillus halophilus]|uniref:Cell shape-determining protein MreC n=1 Tax=Salsuginibacillus halophilus TaxID=517424 RepID=A0A2P8HCL6_9BACI|nr:rod shape-determining protein MreC [Salsuginibacillus halophilus]PSL43969.1 rod shape-determining protein MreC [Salsuginibacillus halophilus]
MPHFFSNKRLIILMVSIILLVAVIGFSTREREELTLPEQFVRDAVGVGQNVFQQPANMINGVVDTIRDIRYVYEENQVLKDRLDEYAMVASERDTLKQENATLQEMADAEESLGDYVTRPALVIHRSPDQWTETIGINKGSQDGIESGMAVITPEGLIGQIDRTSQFSSTVQLLSDGDPSNRVSAMVHTEDDPVYAFVEGWDEEREGLLLRKIESEAEVEEGQLVSTSGLGGVFPRGLTVGEIQEVGPDEYGLTQDALIKPVADFYNIEHVRVIEREAQNLDEQLLDEVEIDDEEDEEEIEEVPLEEGAGDP